MNPDHTSKRPPKRRRRGRPTEPPTQNPTAVLKQARPAVAPLEADVPLTPDEARRMKEHLAFLKINRNLLKLKLNAQEDLLLNGKREPTHRGICLHLLAKVERARVLTASEQLAPKAATELLAGVIRFAPELPYILRFLECVRASETTERASAALSQALQGLDFEALSKAQTRQVVALILEIFPKHEWPGFMLELLDKPAFRHAFDRSSEDWPSALTELLVPLRAVHQALDSRTHDRRPGHSEASASDPDALIAGIAALLAVPGSHLIESLSEPRRQRLLYLGAQALRLAPLAPAPLVGLFEACRWSSAEQRGKIAARLASALLAAGQERFARQLLSAERERLPPASAEWLSLLDQPRLGPLAVQSRARREGRHEGHHQSKGADARASGRESSAPPPRHWVPAWHVPSQQAALLRLGEPTETPLFAEHAKIWRAAWLPQVAPLLASATLQDGGVDRPFLAVQQPGKSFLGRTRQGADRRQWLTWSVELCSLLLGLAQAGVELPDARLSRFSVDASDRLWLIDLWGASQTAPERAMNQHLQFAVAQVREFAHHSDGPLFSGATLTKLSQAHHLVDVATLVLAAY